MIVEFTGCSGAGKTVLREAVVRELAHRGQQVYCPATALLGPSGSYLRNWPRLGNLLLDMRILPKHILSQMFRTESPDSAFQQHCQLTIANHSRSAFERSRLLRSLNRKLALNNYLRTRQMTSQIVLVDEGIIHLAHIIHGRKLQRGKNAVMNLDELRAFSTLAPRPDLLVWVKAPLELLELRIKQRNTHRPLPGQSTDNRRTFLRQADALIHTVTEGTNHASWVLPIENHQQNPHALEHHAKHVADALGKLFLARQAEYASLNQQTIHAA